MTVREEFINYIDEVVPSFPEHLAAFWEDFKMSKVSEKKEMTENGQKILSFMQENMDTYNNIMKAKEIGEGLFISSRSVSGTMRKLITDGYVFKTPGNPVTYSLTDEGKNYSFDN